MKTKKTFRLVSIMYMLLFLLSACNSKLPNSEDVKKISKKVLSETASESNCLQDNQISKGVADIMKNTYYSTLENWPEFSGEIQLNKNIDAIKMQELLNKCESCDGVRVYFGYPEGIQIPGQP